ncbi:PLP-dependent transferase [Aspergillus pseudocaelatus]|uniref:PLP-dependent transferase n=1 Tax=Aspergillus pseudocaelatus TaxID=1825620 RepID=A0ABQ6X0N4_9EURO|nr:PLP-dependent transferase [Aspergillus pseudocaelatus]
MFEKPSDDLLPTSRHTAVAGWFFGPKAENFDYLKEKIHKLLKKEYEYRSELYSDDPAFITDPMKRTGLYRQQLQKLDYELDTVGEWLREHSVPFFSPRYNAHMSMETSMPSLIGFITGLFQNQNNVALEASPVTSVIEGDVGKQLCSMLGYRTPPEKPVPGASKSENETPYGWGHITCDGSVANLEAIWAARNLKFYPLSLKLAITKTDGNLRFLKDVKFEIEICDGTLKSFSDCSSWELLNLKPSTVLNIPKQLYKQFGISQTALANALDPYSVQTKGKRYLLDEFNVKNEPQVFVTATRHYSWPKGAAIAGLGRDNMVDIAVDEDARMCTNDIKEKLNGALAEGRPVYCVVAIIGSTEHGAMDPLGNILEMRREFEKWGMSFVVHCDAAWGGYFASIQRERDHKISTYAGNDPAYVPSSCISQYTKDQLNSLQHADSITVDPHKSGYCPYPAGGLCYRDGQMRYLVTWTSPVVYRDSDQEDSMGIYGVEGSKPGAAAVGVYVSHKVLGLDEKGYGQLLSEAIFTSKRFYCQWAAMKTETICMQFEGRTVKARLRVTPFNMLPTERDGSSSNDIERQKKFIRKHILKRTNEEVMNNREARELLQKLGADLMIHTFACNFEVDGVPNEDIDEANYLNSRIYEQFSLLSNTKNTSEIPLYLTSTKMSHTSYGRSLDQFKRRLGLKGRKDLYVLINVTMSPWPTAYNFVQFLAEKFRDQAEKDMEAAVRRNIEFPDKHGFIIQGYRGDRICGVHLPMFNMQNHRKQLVISCKLPLDVHDKLIQFKEREEDMYFTFGNQEADTLSGLISRGSFQGEVQRSIPDMEGYKQIATDVQISDIRVHLDRSLEANDLSPEYPTKMPFFIYSAQDESGETTIYNMDHILTRGPNTQLTSEMVGISTEKEEDLKIITEKGCWVVLPDVNERGMQPLLPKDDKEKRWFNYTENFPFAPGNTFEFLAFKTAQEALHYDPAKQGAYNPSFTGTVTLGPCFADYGMLNTSTLAHPDGNISSLMAEHPVSSSMLEVKDRYQSQKFGKLRERFKEIKQQQIFATIIPRWAAEVTDLGDRY